MKLFIVLIPTLLNLNVCLTDEDIGCDSVDIFQEIENEELELDEFGDVAFFPDVNIISIVSRSNNMLDKLYIDARLDIVNGRVDLVIFTTDDFKQYSKEQNLTIILLTIEFECLGGQRTLLFSQTLKEGNYFAPEFSQYEYKFVIPTPLYKGYEFTMLQEISAIDHDLWGYDISFSSIDLEDPRILVKTSPKHEMKISFVILELKSAVLSLSKDIKFSIIATDSGNPPRSSDPANIMIVADKSNSLPPIPKFVNTVVYGNLTADLLLPKLKVELDASTYSTDVSFTKLSDEENIFQINSVKNVVFVTLSKQLDRKFLTGRERLTFDIEATNTRLKESGRTAVLISFTQKKALQFKAALYKGSIIAKSNLLEISDFELLANENELEQLDIELQGEKSDLFETELDQNKIKLFVKSSSKASVWVDIKYVSLRLSAETDLKENAFTNIIIDVIHTVLMFEKNVYSGSIENDGELHLDPIVLFTNGLTIEDVDVKLLQPDAMLFSFSRIKNQIIITLQESNENQLSNKRYLRFEVEAKETSTGVKANCLILIDVLRDIIHFHFKAALYKGTLVAKSSTLKIEDFELLANKHESAELDIELQGEKEDLFDIELNQNIIKLFIKPDLKSTVWKNVKYISLRLLARTDSNETTSTNIIIDVVHTILWFEKPAYSGSIENDELNLDPIILLTNSDTIDDIDIKLQQSDAELFSFTRVKNQIVIALRENKENEPRIQKYLRFEVEAQEPSTGVTANCLIFIEILKDEIQFQFQADLYRGKVFATSNTLEIEDFVMLVNGNDLSHLDIELNGEDADIFAAKLNDNVIQLFIESNLNATVWTNIKYVSLRLLVTTDSDKTASTNIIIDVVHTVLRFQEPTYSGSINNYDELNLDPIILLTDSNTIDNVDIKLMQAEDKLFTFTKDKNQILIALKENNENYLWSNNYIRFEVEAMEPNTGVKAKCVILIDIIEDVTPLQFESDFFKGKLIAKSSELMIDDLGLLINEHGLAHLDIELRGDKADFFYFELHENLISLLIKPSLNSTVWTNDKYVSLRLLAKTDSKHSALASITIDVIHTSLLFQKPAYSGSIDNNNTLTLENIVLLTNSDSIDDFNINLVQSDAELFSFTRVENQIAIALKEINQYELTNKRHLMFGIDAEEPATGVKANSQIFIEILQEIIPLHFESALYTGKLLLKSNSLEIDDFEVFSNKHELPQLSIELQGDKAHLFDIVSNKTIITLSLKSTTNASEWINVKYVSLTLLAKTDSEESAMTNIIIDVEHPILLFEKPVYTGSINNDGELNLKPIILLGNIDTIGNVNITLEQTDADLFTFVKLENQIVIELKEYKKNELQSKKYIRFEIKAEEATTGVRASCLIFIDIFMDIIPLQFKASAFNGKLFAKSVSLQIEDFEVLANGNEFDHIEVELQGNEANLFYTELRENVIKLFPKPNSSASEWTNVKHISLRLLAKSDLEEIALTNINIEVIHTVLFFEKPAYTGSINSDNELTLDPIYLLTSSDTTDDVDVQLLQNDAELFSFTKIDNKVIINLQENIHQDDLQNKSYLKFEIEAKEALTGVNASSLIFVELLRDTTMITFEEKVYEAQISNDGRFIMKDIILEKINYKPEVEFNLQGKDAQYFNFQRNENIITLTLNESFSLSEHSDLNTFWVELKAANLKTKQETTAVVIIHIVHEVVPEFEKPNYIADLTQANILNIEKLILKLSTWRAYTFFDLQGNYSDLFECENVGNEIEVSIKSEVPKEVKSLSSIVLVIVASNSAARGYSTIIISLPQSASLTNIFKKAIQTGKIEEGESMQELNINEIELVNEYSVGDFTCQLSGGESEHFEYTAIAPKNVIKLIIATELPNEIIESTFYITFLLECNKKQEESVAGSTIIFLDLPGRQLICPEPEPPTFIPEFESAFYNFFTKPTYVGSLQFVDAQIKGSDAEIRFSLIVENVHLRSRLSINSKSGEVFLTSIVSPGRYYFDIIAENTVTLGQNLSKGRLDVEAFIQCEEHVSVSNSLIIKYLEEEIQHEEILYVKLGNCEFYVFSVEPNNQEYVRIDHNTKMLTMIPTDREDIVFSQMVVPQIEVKLKLDCPDEDVTRSGIYFKSVDRVKRNSNNSISFTNNRSVGLADDIPFSKDNTLLSIMLVDVNDNSPEFVNPKQVRLVIGFPDAKISTSFFTEHLIQIIARDKDVGINGKIKYTIQTNDHFFIDSNSGKIYPYADAMANIKELQLDVYAKDRNGAIDGLNTSFTMVVKVLSAEHFILLTFVNENIKSLDYLLDDVKVRTGVDLLAIKHAIVTSNDTTLTSAEVGSFKSGAAQFMQKVWAYAIEEDVPVSGKVMKRKLSYGEGSFNISIQTFEEALFTAEKYTGQGDLYNSTGYIVGLCVLAIIIVACIGFILWRYIRKINRPTQGSNLLNKSPTIQNFNSKQNAEANIKKQADFLSNSLYEAPFYSKGESVKIQGTTMKESTDDGRRLQIQKLRNMLNGALREEDEESESDSSSGSHRPRTTVKFNELVERIHIESDEDEKRKT